MKVTAFSIYDGSILFTGRSKLILGEAKVLKVRRDNYNVRVTVVDYSDTNKLLAVYVDGQIKANCGIKARLCKCHGSGKLALFLIAHGATAQL